MPTGLLPQIVVSKCRYAWGPRVYNLTLRLLFGNLRGFADCANTVVKIPCPSVGRESRSCRSCSGRKCRRPVRALREDLGEKRCLRTLMEQAQRNEQVSWHGSSLPQKKHAPQDTSLDSYIRNTTQFHQIYSVYSAGSLFRKGTGSLLCTALLYKQVAYFGSCRDIFFDFRTAVPLTSPPSRFCWLRRPRSTYKMGWAVFFFCNIVDISTTSPPTGVESEFVQGV